MNTAALPGDRWILLGVLAIECAVIVILAALIRGRVKSGAGQRTVWQVAMLALAAALALELTGVSRGVAGWLRQRFADSRPPVVNIEPPTVLFVPAPVDVVPLSVSQSTRDMVEPDRPPPLAPPPKNVSPTERANQWVGVIWLLGFGLLAGRIGLRRLMLAVRKDDDCEHSDLQLTKRTQALAHQLGVPQPVHLLESAACLGPVAFGLGQPTIALPPRFTANFSPSQQDAMLAHELAHLAARDPAWYLLADLVSAALWWHPLVWAARRQLHTASELTADEASRIVIDGPAALAESLVKLGAQMTEPQSTVGLGVEGKGFRSGLGQRVERLLQMDDQPWRAPHRLKSLLAKICGPVALVLAAVLCGAWAWPQALLDRETPFTQLRRSWQETLAAMSPTVKTIDQGERPRQLVLKIGDQMITLPYQTGPSAVQPNEEADRRRNDPLKAPDAPPSDPPPPLLYPTLPPKTVPGSQASLGKGGDNLPKEYVSPPLLHPTLPPKRVVVAEKPAVQATPSIGPLLSVTTDVNPLDPPTESAEPKPPAKDNERARLATLDPLKAAKEEALRREETTLVLRQTLGRSQALEKEGTSTSYAAAATLYEECMKLVQKLGGVGVQTELHQVIAGINSCRIALGQQAFRRGDFKEASHQMDLLLKCDPTSLAGLAFQKYNNENKGRSPENLPPPPLLHPTKPPKLVGPAEEEAPADRLQTLLRDAKMLYEMRLFDQAEEKLKQAIEMDSANHVAYYYLSLIQQARYGDETNRRDNIQKQRVPFPNPYVRTNVPNTSTKARQVLMAKMDQVQIAELSFDNVPLTEVVKFLTDECRKQDPKKKGINFIINPFVEDAPTTSQSSPRTNSPPRKLDLDNTRINIKPPIHDLSLPFALDAVCRTADQPIKFIVEDYAVVFAPKQDTGPQQFIRTYKIDPNTFLQGSRRVAGVPVNYQYRRNSVTPNISRSQVNPTGALQGGMSADSDTNHPSVISNALWNYFRAVGVNLGTNATGDASFDFFFNDRTGVLMVRATIQDFEVIEHAIALAQQTPSEAAPTGQTQRQEGGTMRGVQPEASPKARPPDDTQKQRLQEVEKAWQMPPKRELLPSPTPYVRTNAPNTSTKARQMLLAKLDQIQVGEVLFDGLPLSEVVRWLAVECRKHDPEKKGVNFIINPFLNDAPALTSTATNRTAPSSPPLLDAFGNPIAAQPQPAQRIDLDNVLIKINPPLQDLTLHQALDVICKMANQPIQFIVEDYAIVILPGRINPSLYPRTYKTDPNTFKQGLEGVRPAPLPNPGNNAPRRP